MSNDVVLKGTVSLRFGEVPQIHPHRTTLAVGWSVEIGIVGARAILDEDSDAVVADAALAEVVVLEVEGGLGETVLVRDVVDGVDDVERVGTRSVQVDCNAGFSGGVVLIYELSVAGLRGRVGLGILESYHVVASEWRKVLDTAQEI